MKICIVGGIFDKSSEYRMKHLYTPETILFEGLSAKGFDVTAIGHSSFRQSDEFDIIHVHHLGRGAIRMAVTPTRSKFIFTGHSGLMLSNYQKSIKLKLAFQFVAKSADFLIGLTEIECNYLRLYSRIIDRVVKIPNGIPSELFHPFPKVFVHKLHPYRILFVGQLIPSKGVDILFLALKTIGKKIPWELSLVYQNSDQENSLRELAMKLGISNQVHFKGFLSALDLAVLYRNVDVLVLPSYAESLPSVIFEALLSGTPVVATRVGGIPEQLDGSFGELVSPGDWNEMGAALTRVFESLPSYRDRAQEMHDFISNRFSIERMVNDHIQLYEKAQSLIKNRRFSNPFLDRLISRFI